MNRRSSRPGERASGSVAAKRADRAETAAIERDVRRIVDDIARGGDRALKRLTLRYDGVKRRTIEVTASERRAGSRGISDDTRRALRFAARRIERFARLQKRSLRPVRHREEGIVLEQRLLPVRRVGVYVPGGRYPLCSSVLMGAIPARIAGCPQVILCTPPGRAGDVAPEVLAAAAEAGVDRVFAVGGAQAIAAMALGTESIEPVDLIVGPGNRWVTAAKALLSDRVGIDFIAGPTELLVIADATADPLAVASDLVAQAEHDPEARLTLVALGTRIAPAVKRAIRKVLDRLPRGGPNREAAGRAIGRLKVVGCRSLREAANAANKLAPEHLSVQTSRPRALVPHLEAYGSLFLGGSSAVAFGDYVTGPNHVLPTNGAARHTGGLSVLRFLKAVTVQRVSRGRARRLAEPAAALARMEGLEAHALSAEIRAGSYPAAAVLFDFNGVLIDDEEYHWRSIRDVVAPYGVDLTRALYDRRYMAGDDWSVLIDILKDYGMRPGGPVEGARRARVAALETLVRKKQKSYRSMIGTAFCIEPVIARLVRSTAARVPCAVVSGAARAEVVALLKDAGLTDVLSIVVAAEDMARPKPDPSGYRKALAVLRRSGGTGPAAEYPSECLAVEDSPGGIASARAAGIGSVLGVATTYRPAVLKRAGASSVVESLARLSSRTLLTLR